ncbi:MAG: hypothetical protein ABIP81_04890 [Terriglobales bacterium]
MNIVINPVLAKRIRLSGALLLVALSIEAFSLLWSNPTAFLIFIGVGGLFLAAGVAVFLYSLVTPPASDPVSSPLPQSQD